MNNILKWYAINIYSGYELQVKRVLTDKIRTNNLKNYFHDIIIPVETFKNTNEDEPIHTLRLKKCLPGYLIIKCYLNEDVWSLIKSIPKIIGFVGNSKHPVSLTKKDIKNLYKMMNRSSSIKEDTNQFTLGESVQINHGPFENLTGTVKKIDYYRNKLQVIVTFLGRRTPIDVDFECANKLKT